MGERVDGQDTATYWKLIFYLNIVNILSLSAMYICIKCLNIESVDSF